MCLGRVFAARANTRVSGSHLIFCCDEAANPIPETGYRIVDLRSRWQSLISALRAGLARPVHKLAARDFDLLAEAIRVLARPTSVTARRMRTESASSAPSS